MQKLQVMEVHGLRVLTTRQIASMYGTEPEIINNNFLRNKSKYVQEKHFIFVSGEEMRLLRTSHQFDGELKRVSRAYFWTEKGALLHAKSLNTDKAWKVYDYLVDFYFRAKGNTEVIRRQLQIETTPDCIEQILKELVNKTYQSQIGYCKGIVEAVLEKEQGRVGTLIAMYSLLSSAGKKQAMEFMQKEVVHG